MSDKRRTFAVIDGNSLMHRAFHAVPPTMNAPDGRPTNAIFGFLNMFLKMIDAFNPDGVVVAFDKGKPRVRMEMLPQYKAQRPPMDPDLHAQFPMIKELLAALNVPILQSEGWEGDDILGTMARLGEEAGCDMLLVTGDRDMYQLVTEHVNVVSTRKGLSDVAIMTPESVDDLYHGITPALVPDFYGLKGDTSDNIPGVPGIGEKTACKLVQEWGTVENILQNADRIKSRQGEKIAEWGDKLLLAKRLTTICLDVPIDFREEDLTVCAPRIDELKALFAELDFRMFLNDLTNLAPAEPLPEGPRQAAQTQLAEVARAKSAAAKKAALAGQGDLFAPAADSGESPASDRESASSDEQTAESEEFATAQTTPHAYTIVRNAQELEAVLREVAACPEFCFDTETTGFDIFNDRIVGLSLAVRPYEAWYIPFNESNTAEYAALIRPLFADGKIAKIGQNIKFDLMVLARLGVEIRGRLYDTMILHYLLDPESRHNMDALAMRYLNYRPISITSLIGKGARQLTMDMISLERVAEYAAEDADVTLRLKQVLWPKVEELDLAGLYLEIEEPMIAVLAEIEMAGVRIDSEALAEYAVELNKTLNDLEGDIRRLADEPSLNVNSARQLGEVLFGKLRIAEKPKMTKTKQFSTEEEYLQTFAHKYEIVDKILEYRGVKKLLSTYVEALPLLVNPVTGKIHTSFNQAVTATGRLSSTNPNLQNIPVRDELGRRIRKAFIPSDDEHLLLSADYSQVELRLMAHLSGDESLIAAFEHGEDVHAATAARLFGKEVAEVDSDERRKAKTANFGIIYGISAFGLSQRLDIPRKEAKEIIEGYFASYPKVKEYMDRVVEEAKRDGYVSTIFGRRRYLNDIASRNAVARGLAERNAVNAPIQGSAADIMKIAMIRVSRRFREEGIRSKVILQVHDELVVDMLRSEQERVIAIVTEAMESAAALRVRLVVDCGVGDNWLEAH